MRVLAVASITAALSIWPPGEGRPAKRGAGRCCCRCRCNCRDRRWTGLPDDVAPLPAQRFIISHNCVPPIFGSRRFFKKVLIFSMWLWIIAAAATCAATHVGVVWSMRFVASIATEAVPTIVCGNGAARTPPASPLHGRNHIDAPTRIGLGRGQRVWSLVRYSFRVGVVKGCLVW